MTISKRAIPVPEILPLKWAPNGIFCALTRIIAHKSLEAAVRWLFSH